MRIHSITMFPINRFDMIVLGNRCFELVMTILQHVSYKLIRNGQVQDNDEERLRYQYEEAEVAELQQQQVEDSLCIEAEDGG